MKLNPSKKKRLGLRIEGIVQGVGFRPFLCTLAEGKGITGKVYNDGYGVYVEVQGDSLALEKFLEGLEKKAPPLSRIDHVEQEDLLLLEEESQFTIVESRDTGTVQTFIGADTTPCDACLEELQSSEDRRHEYAFINCTHCGPRYTIIEQIPYDRPYTSMKAFPLCAHCEREYKDIENRRFHAEPNACPLCGPTYTLIGKDGVLAEGAEALRKGRELVEAGAIIALKGVGGYHLVCDATQDEVVKELRRRKQRPHKPLAIMVGSLQAAKELAHIDEEEERLLCSRERPIVLLRKKDDDTISPSVAPHNGYIGMMLPYAPVHHVLLPSQALWVMTSGNKSSEPVIYDDEDALYMLDSLVDYVLYHNRQIVSPVDDSVAMVEEKPILMRRSRGYVPLSVYMKGLRQAPMALAMGGDIKNAFAFQKMGHVLLGPHVGDLENVKMYEALENSIHRYMDLFDGSPQYIVGDAHPGYVSSRIGRELSATWDIPFYEVQHHHAHVGAVMAEYDVIDGLLGVCFDGTGYGDDGSIWGGEFLYTKGAHYERVAHIDGAPLPGGEKAVKEPWRQALWYIRSKHGAQVPTFLEPWLESLPRGWEVLDRMLATSMPMMNSTSGGRLFDAVGAILGLGHVHSFDAQVAIALEQLSLGVEGKDWQIPYEGGILHTQDLVYHVLDEMERGVPREQIGANFHRSLAAGIVRTLGVLRESWDYTQVALCGGVFQNRRLLQEIQRLYTGRENLLIPRHIPINDGGLAVGQLWIAHERMKQR